MMGHFKTSLYKSPLGEKNRLRLPNGPCTLTAIFSMFASWDHQCPPGQPCPLLHLIFIGSIHCWLNSRVIFSAQHTFTERITMIHLPWARSLSLWWFFLLLWRQKPASPNDSCRHIWRTQSDTLITIMIHATWFWLWPSLKWRHPCCLSPDWSFVLLCYHLFVVLLICLLVCLSVCLSVAHQGLFAFLQHIHIHTEAGHSTWRCVCVCRI